MTANPPLRLLQIPWLALVHAVRMMNVEEQYKLSTLSKRARRIVWRSSFGRPIVFSLGFYVTGAAGSIGYQPDEYRYTFEIEPANPLNYPTVNQCIDLISKVGKTFKTVHICLENRVPAMKVPLVREFIPLARRLGMRLDKLVAHVD